MKKHEYVSPEMEIVEIEMLSVIAGSPTIDEGDDDDLFGGGDPDDNDP